MTSQEHIRDLRAELVALRARHDSSVVPHTTYDVVRKLETNIAWLEHHAEMEMRRREQR
jgi:hypothetical protein